MAEDRENGGPKSEQREVSRRRLLKLLGAGGVAAVVLPDQWRKPVIDSIMTPAHATGSPWCEPWPNCSYNITGG